MHLLWKMCRHVTKSRSEKIASFIGTNKDFKRFIGPRTRNRVNAITRAYLRSHGQCQHCQATDRRLEAAHVTGRERTVIIDGIVEEFTNDETITIDLEVFEAKFEAEHHPISENILALCNSCHRKYDAPMANPEPLEAPNLPEGQPDTNDGELPSNSEITDYFRAMVPHRLPDGEIESLCKARYCKEIFNINFVVLKEIPSMASLQDVQQFAQDDNGRARWSTVNPIVRDARRYIVTTQWYDRNRMPFSKWKASIEAN